jgi:hypothetical protein
MFGKYLKEAVSQSDDQGIKSALIQGTAVIKARPERRITLRGFAENYLPQQAADYFLSRVDNQWELDAEFRLEKGVFDSVLRYESLLIEKDFVITGPSDLFSKVVEIQPSEGNEPKVLVKADIISRKLTSRK